MTVPAPESGVSSRCNLWTGFGRFGVFALAATSIACLLLEFYRLCPMRTFTLFVFLPALCLLCVVAGLDYLKGDRQLWRAVMIGVSAGLAAAIAYDLFRLPFVYSREWGIEHLVPPLKLFKVFPRFGAMILGEPIEQDHYSSAASLIGWAYHFSNGATFGAMYVALVGDVTRRSWGWAVLMAVGLELGMLFTPYAGVFGIVVSALFVAVTLIAHLIFGVALGLSSRWLGTQWPTQLRSAASSG